MSDRVERRAQRDIPIDPEAAARAQRERCRRGEHDPSMRPWVGCFEPGAGIDCQACGVRYHERKAELRRLCLFSVFVLTDIAICRDRYLAELDLGRAEAIAAGVLV